MNSKHLKRVLTDFEEILLKLSEDSNACYAVADQKAKEYISEFSKKKNLNNDERNFLLENCIDMIQDWFPDTSNIFSFANF